VQDGSLPGNAREERVISRVGVVSAAVEDGKTGEVFVGGEMVDVSYWRGGVAVDGVIDVLCALLASVFPVISPQYGGTYRRRRSQEVPRRLWTPRQIALPAQR